jgi:preprotein translocase subunit YajC
MDFFISNAYAQGAGGTEGLLSLLPLVLIFVVFYFLLIRPQSKKQKEHREMVAALTVGDEVATAGGLLGKVTQVKESFVRIELADNVVVTVQRHTVSAVMPKGTLKSV